MPGDAGLLRHAVNLLDNSVLHNKSGCRVSIALRGCDVVAKLTVSDDGRGVPDSFLQRLNDGSAFEHSARVHGMGLYIVRQIVKAHEGTIRFGRSGSGGLAVTLTIPAAEQTGRMLVQHSLITKRKAGAVLWPFPFGDAILTLMGIGYKRLIAKGVHYYGGH